MVGVSLRWASPGAQTSTLRSLPTSEWTPNVGTAGVSWLVTVRLSVGTVGFGAGQSSIQPTARAITPTTAPAIETAQMTASRGENRRRCCSRLALMNSRVAGA